MKEYSPEAWAKWRRLISEQRQSGKSVAVFCEERGLREWQYYEWKKRLREARTAQFDVTTFGCGDNLSLITSSNTQQAMKYPEDFCPACNTGYNGTNGHIDNYSTSQACSGHSVGDYGNYWTADTYTTE
jgi:hypothetical protein